jgi:hypothetical protein
MKKSIILATAAGVGLSLGIIAAQAGPGAHGQAGGNAVPPNTPGFHMGTGGPGGASLLTPGQNVQTISPADRGTSQGASTFAPGTFAPGRK